MLPNPIHVDVTLTQCYIVSRAHWNHLAYALCIIESSFPIMATETHTAKRIDYGQIDLERTYTFWNPQQLACLHDALIGTAYLSTAFNCTVGSPRRPDSRKSHN